MEEEEPDDSPLDRDETCPVEENAPGAVDEWSQEDLVSSPSKKLKSGLEPGSSFWTAPTPPVRMFSVDDPQPGCSFDRPEMTLQDYTLHRTSPQCSFKHHQTIKSSFSLHRSRATINLLEPEGRRSRSRNPPTPKNNGITMLTTTFKMVTENPNFWSRKTHFRESINVYFCRFPRMLLANAVISHTLRFKAHETFRNFRMQQKLVYRNSVLKQWSHEKGLVCSQVVTIWETMMERLPGSNFIVDQTLTSRVVLETQLYDGERLLYEYKMHIMLT